jgi:MYXO-CTERM domain-containing protein
VKRAAWVLLVLALPAQAYVRTKNTAGVCIWWPSRTHSFQIASPGTPDAPDADVFNAIRLSFQTWGAVSCSDLTFTEESLTTDPKSRIVGFSSGGTNHNLVMFRIQACRDTNVVPAGDPCRSAGGCGNKYDCWDEVHGDGVIAVTTTTTNRFSGEIFDSDIELNNAPHANGTKFTFTALDGPKCVTPLETGCVRIDVQNTVTHEAGHYLGLDHPPDHPEATMYASAPSGEVSKRTLAQDDIAGICSIYPKGASTATCGSTSGALTQPSGGCGCSQGQTGPGAALAALLFLVHGMRRSRRRPQLAIMSSTRPATATRAQSGSEY